MSESRKQDHIEHALNARPSHRFNGDNLYYEPLFSAYPSKNISFNFLSSTFEMPLWISSMTGGTEKAFKINQNLARACQEFKIGMGLGSCRPLLASDERFRDFDLRSLIGDRPLYANLGIAQLEEELDRDNGKRVIELIKKLQVNGLIIHVNPLQEFFQPEGDRFKYAPIETIKRAIDHIKYPLMVKEVGQGFGPLSLQALIELPLECIELSAFGGTNFSILELERTSRGMNNINEDFSSVGHTAEEMIAWINKFWTQSSPCKSFIISGGIESPLQGHKLKESLVAPSIIGMASQILKYAQGEYDELAMYLQEVREGFYMAQAYMRSEKQ